jgi:hypothetical protein
LVLGFIGGAALIYLHTSSQSTLISSILLRLVGTAFGAFIIFKISQGRNWARIVFTVQFGFGLINCVSMMMHSPLPDKIYMLLQSTIQAYILVLLFSREGNSIFLGKERS